MCNRPHCHEPATVGVMRLDGDLRWKYTDLCDGHAQETWDRAREQGHDFRSRSMQTYPLHA